MIANSNQSLRTQVLLSLQRALWGMVTPDLIAVAVGWSDGIRVRFVYDHAITPALDELVSEVETEVLADFPVRTITVFYAEEGTAARPLMLKAGEGWWAYIRREDA